MAAPNIVAVSTITGKTALAALTTSTASILSNSAASGTVVKVNTVTVANYSGSAVSVTVTILRSSTSYYLAGTVSVPANATLIIVGKDNFVYLEEGDTLQASSSVNSAASIYTSYEIIS